MLWTNLSADGVLTIEVEDGIEAYAVEAWYSRYKQGKAKLQIKTGKLVDLNEAIRHAFKNVQEFKTWQSERKRKVLDADPAYAASQVTFDKLTPAGATDAMMVLDLMK